MLSNKKISIFCFYPNKHGLFSRSPGSGGLRGPDAKSQGQLQPIEMQLQMRHYNHKSIPDARFESGSSSNFEDMTSQNFPQKKEQVIEFGYLSPENRLNFKKISFYVQNRSSSPKVDPHVNFSNFQAEEMFFIFKIFGTSPMRKEQQQLPD